MSIPVRRTINRVFTLIVLTAASFWLFACQASAANDKSITDTDTAATLFAGICFIMIAALTHIWRQRANNAGVF